MKKYIPLLLALTASCSAAPRPSNPSDGDTYVSDSGIPYIYKTGAWGMDGFNFSIDRRDILQEASSELTISPVHSRKRIFFTGESLLIPNNPLISNVTISAKDATVFIDSGVQSGLRSGQLTNGDSVDLESNGTVNFVFGEIESLDLSKVDAEFYLNSQDYNSGAGTITDRINGRVFTAQATQLSGLRLSGTGGAHLQLPSKISLGSNFEIEFRVRLGLGTFGAGANNNRGMTYEATSSDGIIMTSSTQLRFRADGVNLGLNHGIADLTQMHTYRLVADGTNLSLFIDGATTAVASVAFSGNFELLQIGRYNGLAIFTQDYDYFTVKNNGTLVLDLQMNENSGSATQDAVSTNDATIVGFDDDEWLNLGTGPVSMTSLAAPAGDTALQGVDSQNLVYSGGAPITLDIPNLPKNSSDQLITSYNNGSYEMLFLKSASAAKAVALTEGVTPQSVPIIVYTGQSNTLGKVRNVTPYTNEVFPQTLYTTSTTTVQAATAAGTAFGGNWEMMRLIKDNGFNGGNFAAVISGLGGIPAHFWSPGGSNESQWVQLQDKLDAFIAEKAISEPSVNYYVHSVVYQQGERDADTNTSTTHWKSNVNPFADAVRAKYGANIRFYFPSLATFQEQGYTTAGVQNVRGQQLQITQVGDPDYLANSEYIELNPLNKHQGDFVHYTVAGYDEVGIKLYNAFADDNGLPAVTDPNP